MCAIFLSFTPLFSGENFTFALNIAVSQHAFKLESNRFSRRREIEVDQERHFLNLFTKSGPIRSTLCNLIKLDILNY